MNYTPFINAYTPYICGYNMGFQSNNGTDIMKEAAANILKQLADNRPDWSWEKKELYKSYIDAMKRTNREDEKEILLFIISTMWCLT